jgi:hypothetical protein
VLDLVRDERSSLWAFCDPAQQFWQDRVIPDCEWSRVPPRHPYRSHNSIHALGQLYLGQAADLTRD